MRRPTFGRRRRTDDGVVAIIVALLVTSLFVVAAFVVDLGFAKDTRRQAQNAADAASLAAGNSLYGTGTTPRYDEAIQAAKDYASRNYGVTEPDWAACVDPTPLRHRPAGAPACISFQSSIDPKHDVTRPDTVRVRMPVRVLKTTLGAVAGVSEIRVAAEAHARVSFTTLPSCSLCVLGPGPHNLQNGKVTVKDGDIHFNGSVEMSPAGVVTTEAIWRTRIQGTASGGTYLPPPLTGQPAITDPLAFLTMPTWTDLAPKTDPCVHGPGIYGSFDLKKTCKLPPGLYVITGLWRGNGSVEGKDVTLYFTCGTSTAPAVCPVGGTGGTVNMSGGGMLKIDAPLVGPLKGLALVYDRNNTVTSNVIGSSGAAITGTIYGASATLQFNGNGCLGALQSQIVVRSIELHGDPSCLQSHYAKGTNADYPPGELHLSR